MPNGRVRRWVSDHRWLVVAIVVGVVVVGVVVGVVVWLTTRRRPDGPPSVVDDTVVQPTTQKQPKPGIPVRAQYIRLAFAEAGVQSNTSMTVLWSIDGKDYTKAIDGLSGDLEAPKPIKMVAIIHDQTAPTDRQIPVILELLDGANRTVVYRETLQWTEETTATYNRLRGVWMSEPRQSQ